MQFQSDILGTRVERPEVREVTALGAAYLAGLAVGFWQNLDELQEKAVIEREFRPGIETTSVITVTAAGRKRSNAPWRGKITKSNVAMPDGGVAVRQNLRVGQRCTRTYINNPLPSPVLHFAQFLSATGLL